MTDMTVTKCPKGCGWEWVSRYDDGAVMLLDHLPVCPARIAKVDRENAAVLAACLERRAQDKGQWRPSGPYS